MSLAATAAAPTYRMPFSDRRPSTRGRFVALLYLLVVAAGIVAQAVIADGFLAGGDAQKLAANIKADRSLYQLGFSIFMIEMAAQVAMTVLFYDLLKPVDRGIARLSATLGLVGCGIKMFARVFYYAPLILLSGAAYLSSTDPAHLATMSLAALQLNSHAAGIALVFFGFETVLRGWLIYRSGFLPRFLGIVSMAGGLGWLTFIWPPLGYRAFLLVAPIALVGVMLTAGWLLIRGIDDSHFHHPERREGTS